MKARINGTIQTVIPFRLSLKTIVSSFSPLQATVALEHVSSSQGKNPLSPGRAAPLGAAGPSGHPAHV